MNKRFLMLLLASTLTYASRAAECHLEALHPARIARIEKVKDAKSITYRLKLTNYPNAITATQALDGSSTMIYESQENCDYNTGNCMMFSIPIKSKYFAVIAQVHAKMMAAQQVKKESCHE